MYWVQLSSALLNSYSTHNVFISIWKIISYFDSLCICVCQSNRVFTFAHFISLQRHISFCSSKWILAGIWFLGHGNNRPPHLMLGAQPTTTKLQTLRQTHAPLAAVINCQTTGPLCSPSSRMRFICYIQTFAKALSIQNGNWHWNRGAYGAWAMWSSQLQSWHLLG